jgi:hypothetical protein
MGVVAHELGHYLEDWLQRKDRMTKTDGADWRDIIANKQQAVSEPEEAGERIRAGAIRSVGRVVPAVHTKSRPAPEGDTGAVQVHQQVPEAVRDAPLVQRLEQSQLLRTSRTVDERMKISLTESGKDCLLTEFRVGPVFSLLKGMPGRNKWIDRNLAFQPTGANIAFILQHFPDAEWTGGSEILRDNWINLKMKEDNTRAEKHLQLVDNSGYEFKTVPYEHQKQAFVLSRDREAFALFHEQGTGKTKTIIDTAAYLYEKGEIDTLIVLAKNGVHINWVLLEIPAHLPDRIPYMAAYYTADMPKSEYRSIFAMAATNTCLGAANTDVPHRGNERRQGQRDADALVGEFACDGGDGRIKPHQESFRPAHKVHRQSRKAGQVPPDHDRDSGYLRH